MVMRMAVHEEGTTAPDSPLRDQKIQQRNLSEVFFEKYNSPFVFLVLITYNTSGFLIVTIKSKIPCDLFKLILLKWYRIIYQDTFAPTGGSRFWIFHEISVRREGGVVSDTFFTTTKKKVKHSFRASIINQDHQQSQHGGRSRG